jgi:uncharacterized DUF497 family protein
LEQMPGKPAALFDWDDANRAHLGRHDIAPDEAEQVVLGSSLPLEIEERSGKERHTELGETSDGRLVVVVWTWRRGRVRVVTAFPAKRKWRALWRRVKGGHDD